jgi:plastocyanin
VRQRRVSRAAFLLGIGKRSTIAAATALAVAFVACGGNSPSTPAASAPKATKSSPGESGGSEEETITKTIAGQSVNFKKSADVSQESSVEVEADDFYFSPTVLTGKPGQTLTLELKNEGTATHNFSLPAQHISQNLEVGQDKEVKVTFPQSGTLLFHCAFHASSGMRGALETSS